jgi:CRISPR-associated endonuclease/helicase Cas3
VSVIPEEFEEFFHAVHGFLPFPWQVHLARRVTGLENSGRDNIWPECLALPTGSGKTACLDIAIFALACEAERPPAERTAPRRIIFVVDRRVIVDEAFSHASETARRLKEPQPGILTRVAEALRKISGQTHFLGINGRLADGDPLTHHQLRGGTYRDDAWARSPTQPCIIASTVDQIGSRILFRGYGQSNKNWPLHAGLAGNDSLIILDEAHCSTPFFQTMQWISRYRGNSWKQIPLNSPFQFVVMSATPPAGVTDVLRDQAPDRDHPVLGRRIGASKPTALASCGSAKGSRALEELAIEMVGRAARLVSPERRTIAILVNRVETARLIDQLLRASRGNAIPEGRARFEGKTIAKVRRLLPEEYDQTLLTGRMRPADKDRVTADLRKLKTRTEANAGEVLHFTRPLFVTATQCLEVGADLDFDAMVTECASLDALRQRFGRLNRSGRDFPCSGVVVVRGDQMRPGTVDPIYETKLTATWDWLNEHADRGVNESEPTIDFGISAMNGRWEATSPDVRSSVVLQGVDAPVMLPAYIDCWVQTAPEPRPSPDVALFLHGPKDATPEVQVCWRGDVPLSGLGDDVDERESAFVEAVTLCLPTSRECLPVPLHVFRRWLSEPQATSVKGDDISDLDAAPLGEDESRPVAKYALTLAWRGPDDSRLIRDPIDARPGDTIVIPAGLGGIEVFGHIPDDRPLDIADECQIVARRRAVLRLQPDLIRTWFAGASEDESYRELMERIGDSPTDFDWPLVREAMERLLSDGISVAGQQVAKTLEFADALSDFRPMQHPFGGVSLRTKRLPIEVQGGESQAETITTEDDSSSYVDNSRPISLAEHCEAVATHARIFGETVGLPPKVVRSLALAGRYHDLGKADRRFQAMLHGGHQLRADLAATLYAKSQGLPVTPKEQRQARRLSQLPEDFRHESLSLSIVEHVDGLLTRDSESDRDLVLHLIAAHHGHARPFVPVVLEAVDAENQILEIDLSRSQLGLEQFIRPTERHAWTPVHRLDSGAAERFWRLVRRYGWWGLAWLEAILVLADHRRSELEMRLGGEVDSSAPTEEAALT